MTWLLTPAEIGPHQEHQVGGKGAALARLARAGWKIPQTLCVTVAAYHAFVRETGLGERILLELKRKEFSDMRWEELWDTALRIRRLFLAKPLPARLLEPLTTAFRTTFGNAPLAIRSSASDEDADTASFAGLHESYVNVRGPEAAAEHVKRVWASLWSDAALLYRKELGLAVERSAMAVVVQRLIEGEASGILFTRSPEDPKQAVLEAVHGLNAALVDGLVEPDRWRFDRADGKMLEHRQPVRKRLARLAADGFELADLPPPLAGRSPLTDGQAREILRQGLALEHHFGRPQDIEWTYTVDTLWLLQTRPITTARNETAKGDERGWYLSLRRSLENLKALRQRLEGRWIPEMIRTAERLRQTDLAALSDHGLRDALAERLTAERRWTDLYWRDFIPFAHGMRLFGQIYNDRLKPEDSFEFMNLLVRGELESVRRNALLEDLAAALRAAGCGRESIDRPPRDPLPPEIQALADQFLDQFGDTSFTIHGRGDRRSARAALVRLAIRLAERPQGATRPGTDGDDDRAALERRFLDRFSGEERARMAELLDLARASYRLRDDDNIYLARIQARTVEAQAEVKRRLESTEDPQRRRFLSDLMAKVESDLPRDRSIRPASRESEAAAISQFRLRPRQIVGQPAGPGLAQGPARVINDSNDLMEFRANEILVCDALTPMMTFVVPLAAAVVERRGGMLIHGAIIAREYGLPCVTGIPEATRLIHTGDQLTVDGHLGIVTVISAPDSNPSTVRTVTHEG